MLHLCAIGAGPTLPSFSKARFALKETARDFTLIDGLKLSVGVARLVAIKHVSAHCAAAERLCWLYARSGNFIEKAVPVCWLSGERCFLKIDLIT